MNTRNKWIVGTVGLLLAGAGVWLATRQAPAPQDAQPLPLQPKIEAQVKSKGSAAPLSSISSIDEATRNEREAQLKEIAEFNAKFDSYVKGGFGKFEPVDIKYPTKQIESVLAALKVPGSHPERFSANVTIPNFDREEYLRDPSAYCALHVPARCQQAAQPGPGIKRLEAISPYYQELAQSESTVISVRSEPGMPVTLTAMAGGVWEESRLMSITTQAGPDGVAQAKFLSVPGAHSDCPILVASPARTGVLRFVVHAKLPSKT
jgi:hypothetical protein